MCAGIKQCCRGYSEAWEEAAQSYLHLQDLHTVLDLVNSRIHEWAELPSEQKKKKKKKENTISTAYTALIASEKIALLRETVFGFSISCALSTLCFHRILQLAPRSYSSALSATAGLPLSLPPPPSASVLSAGLKDNDAELMQYLLPVGRGPSSKMCPR